MSYRNNRVRQLERTKALKQLLPVGSDWLCPRLDLWRYYHTDRSCCHWRNWRINHRRGDWLS
ncbi:hypothetical protein [Marinomonas gallaica]|uniref:hypothetical protein n=1 Tax=Marinomonas gallaica TaxID=1806667 RepID=UPI003A92C4EA